jgi:hypothetical protein
VGVERQEEDATAADELALQLWITEVRAQFVVVRARSLDGYNVDLRAGNVDRQVANLIVGRDSGQLA